MVKISFEIVDREHDVLMTPSMSATDPTLAEAEARQAFLGLFHAVKLIKRLAKKKVYFGDSRD